jgi:flavin-dependent dehydrogenase
VPVYYDGAAPSVKGNVIVTGDTGHLVDPFLGEGIYYAIRTAKYAASVIIDNIKAGKGLGEYQAWLEREIHPEFKAAESSPTSSTTIRGSGTASLRKTLR